MTRPLGKALIGLSHGIRPERETLGEAQARNAREEARNRLYEARMTHKASETDLIEAPASFFIPPRKEQHGPEERG